MNSVEVVPALNKLFSGAPESGKRTDGPMEFREDHAAYLSLGDIRDSAGSDELKVLLEDGFRHAHGEMTVIIIHHKPTGGKPGRFIYELAGQPEQGTRIGAEMVVWYTSEGDAEEIKVLPHRKC
jgi:hypothetical protein